MAAARPFLRYWLPVIAYVAMIFSVSSIPHLQPPFHFANADKVMHMSEYSVLGLLLTRALRSLPSLHLLTAGLIAIGTGMTVAALDETYQRGIPGRESDVRDWIADSMGLSLAAMGYAWAKRPRGDGLAEIETH